jgi:Tfp pilus assembly protein PilN
MFDDIPEYIPAERLDDELADTRRILAELGRITAQRDVLAQALQRIDDLDFDGHNDAHMLDLITEFACAALATLGKEGINPWKSN